jgi:hypothetical protein
MLGSVGFDAGIIGPMFYTTLVVTAVDVAVRWGLARFFGAQGMTSPGDDRHRSIHRHFSSKVHRRPKGIFDRTKNTQMFNEFNHPNFALPKGAKPACLA